MAITHDLAPVPLWLIANNMGTLAGGAKLYTYRNLNKSQTKAVYQDPAGTIPYTNPILFNANGSQGPFYWEVDSDNADDTYYLEAYDSNDTLLWTIENFGPVTGGGGGSSSTSTLPLRNMIANNVFLDHAPDLANPITVTNAVLAPDNHRRFTPDQIPVVGTFGEVGPDFRFVKNNTAATDAITFENFTLGLDPLTGDVTPELFCRYECTNSPVGETYKAFQWPIVQGVNNLDNQTLTFSIWAKVDTTPVDVFIYTRQYFGSGGSPSAEVRELKATLSLSTDWTKFTVSIAVPNTSGKTLGTCGDDALYIQMGLPLGAPANILFTKPSLYLGAINPVKDFQTYDEINTILSSPRTGDVRISMNAHQPFGWIEATNGTIGNASSNATSRANIDTFPLFATIWNIMNSNPTYAPIYTSAGAASTYGASAVADFDANKQLGITQLLARALAGTGPSVPTPQNFTVNTGTDELTITTANQYGTGCPVKVSNSGGSLPAPLDATQTYYVIFVNATTIKLALTLDNAVAGTAINITTAGTGTHSIVEYIESTGIYTGVDNVTLTEAQMPPHVHGYEAAVVLGNIGGVGSTQKVGRAAMDTTITGGGEPHPNLPPTIYMNMYFKL